MLRLCAIFTSGTDITFSLSHARVCASAHARAYLRLFSAFVVSLALVYIFFHMPKLYYSLPLCTFLELLPFFHFFLYLSHLPSIFLFSLTFYYDFFIIILSPFIFFIFPEFLIILFFFSSTHFRFSPQLNLRTIFPAA